MMQVSPATGGGRQRLPAAVAAMLTILIIGFGMIVAILCLMEIRNLRTMQRDFVAQLDTIIRNDKLVGLLGNAREEIIETSRSMENRSAVDMETTLNALEEKVDDFMANQNQECVYGIASVIARRIHDGKEVQYWPSLFAKIPKQVKVVAVLNRLGTNLTSSSITKVLVPNSDEPPDFAREVIQRNLKRNFNDSLARVRWRSKIVLDFIRVVRYVSDVCRYVLWLEDDARAPDAWFETMLELTPVDTDSWLLYWLSKGMPAVLINSRYADFLLQYLTHHFDDQPVDWLVTDATKKLQQLTKKKVKFPPDGKPIFGHQGVVSTLQEAKDRPVF